MGKKQKRASELLDIIKKQAKENNKNKTSFSEENIPFIEKIYDLTKNTYMSIFNWIGIGCLKDACVNMTDVKELYRKIDDTKYEDHIKLIDEFIELCIVRLHCYIQKVCGQATWLDYLKEIQHKDFFIRHAEEFAPYTASCVEYCLHPPAFFNYRPPNYVNDGGKIFQGMDAAFADGNPNCFSINLPLLNEQIPQGIPKTTNVCDRCKKDNQKHLFKLNWLESEPFVCSECDDILNHKRLEILEKMKEDEELGQKSSLTEADYLKLYESIKDF